MKAMIGAFIDSALADSLPFPNFRRTEDFQVVCGRMLRFLEIATIATGRRENILLPFSSSQNWLRNANVAPAMPRLAVPPACEGDVKPEILATTACLTFQSAAPPPSSAFPTHASSISLPHPPFPSPNSRLLQGFALASRGVEPVGDSSRGERRSGRSLAKACRVSRADRCEMLFSALAVRAA